MPRGGKRAGAGRKPKAINQLKKQAIESAGGDASRALGIVVSIMDTAPLLDRLKLDAAREVMDRVWGKSVQALEHSGPDGGEIRVKIMKNASYDDI